MKKVVWIFSLLVLFLFLHGFNAMIGKVSQPPFSQTDSSIWLLEEIEASDPITESMLAGSYFLIKPEGEVKIMFNNQVEKATWEWEDQLVGVNLQNQSPLLKELEGSWQISQATSRKLELTSEEQPITWMKFKRVRP